jgi:flagellar biosynthetic protein FliR
MLDLEIGVQWAIGLTLAIARAGAFVGLCPWIPRSIPKLGRSSLALALGLVIMSPVAMPADVATSDLLTAGFVNVTLGAILGWFLGMPLFAFQVAGSVLDATSGISMGAVFDPDSDTSPGPISKGYTLTAQTLVIAGGGLTVLTQVLWMSTRAIALDGRLGEMSMLSGAAVQTVNTMMRDGVQIALPIAAVLFLAELAFGLLSRMAPQINIFLVGIPLKTLLTLSLLGSASVAFPRAVDNVISSGTSTVLQFLGG